MKKTICLLVLVFVLSGCRNETTLETLGNPCSAEPVVEPAEIKISLPEQVAEPVLQDDQVGKLYLCDGFSVSVQTLSGGDLDQTVHSCTGYCMDELTVIKTEDCGFDRYDFVCTAAGESEQQVLRTAIIDDGVFHYVLTAMAPASNASQHTESLNDLFASFDISTDQ